MDGKKHTLFKRLRRSTPDLLLYTGASCISVGAGMIYLPAGLIVVGLAFFGIALLLVRGGEE